MCASALFTGMTPRECKEIASCAHTRTFARDELLFMQGQPVRSMVLIQSGSVKLTQLSANGNEVILWMNGSGDAMGVHADSPSCSHTCSARAMEQCKALVWEYTRLQMLVAEYPQFRRNISQILASRLQELEERFREIATEKVARAPGACSYETSQASRQKDRRRHGSFSFPRGTGSAHRHHPIHHQPHSVQMGGTRCCDSAPRSRSGSRSRRLEWVRFRRRLRLRSEPTKCRTQLVTECGIVLSGSGCRGRVRGTDHPGSERPRSWSCLQQAATRSRRSFTIWSLLDAGLAISHGVAGSHVDYPLRFSSVMSYGANDMRNDCEHDFALVAFLVLLPEQIVQDRDLSNPG